MTGDDLHQDRQSTRSLVETVVKAINRAPILSFHFVVDDADDIADARRIDEACTKYGVCCALHPHLRDEEPEEVEHDGDVIVVLTQLCSVIPETDGWTTMDVRTRENVTDSLAQSIGSCLRFLSPMPASMWGKKEFVVVASIYDAIWELATFLGEVPMLYRAVHMKIERQLERIDQEGKE